VLINKRTMLLMLGVVASLIVYSLDILTAERCALLALLVCVYIGWIVVKEDGARLSYTTVILMYTMATEFGLVIPNLLIGESTTSNYMYYTLAFLGSSYLNDAIMLGIIAVLSMRLGVQFARSRKKLPVYKPQKGYTIYENVGISNKLYFAGVVLIAIVIAYFAYYLATGGMQLFSTYEQYRQSAAYQGKFYSYVLIVFYVGTLYLASAGTVRKHLAGWILWFIPVVIFALNGNKGEFLYSFLAVLGMKGIEGNKISRRLVLTVVVLVFLVIPLITSLRSIGIVGNLSSASFSVFDAATEMGMQIRMTVYVLEDMANGTTSALLGRSYLQPIFNIITPFISHTQATAVIREAYGGYGFNQVIESYVNFGVTGVLAFFGIMGYWLGRVESRINDRLSLAYIGTITSILINATRNYFAFVPGQILLITIVYFFIKKMKV